MPRRTLTVHSNPYAHIDANGRLAGATPVAEAPRPTTVAPVRDFVGARRILVEHDTVGRGVGSARLPRSEYRWAFSAEPVKVDASGQLAGYYQQRIAAGELFLASDKGAVPLAALARARMQALASFKAEHGVEADTSEWAEQYPLDLEVEAAGEVVAEQDKVARERAVAEQKKAAADAKAEREKADGARKSALDERRAAARESARRALGAPSSGPVPDKPKAEKESVR